MPFQLSNKPTFKYKVKVKQARDAGKLEEFEFTAEYKRLDQAAIKDVLALTSEQIFRKITEELWVGWVVGEIKALDGSNLEPSAEGRAAMLLEPGVPQALMNGWMDAVFFGPAKN